MITTRFAPSPTGFLHIGGVRTALFNWLYAKKNSGKFLLRIEDTDRERSSKEAIKKIIDGLNWLGLENDGEIVYQHKNEERHIEVAHILLEAGFAYRDWELENDYGDLEKNHAIRFKTPKEGETIINDKVQGDVEIKNKEIEDFVLLRSNGTPTYMLSVVVDDYDMNVTDIIRGDDHLTNAAKQKLIYDSLKWECPTFTHIPLIHGQDGSKLSKRHGALGIEFYKEEGYLPEALINYLLRLGWSHGDQEIFSLEEMIKYFSIEKIRKSPSKFDIDKLNDINSIYLKNTPIETLISKIDSSHSNLSEKKFKSLSIVMPEILKRCKNIKDIEKNINFIINERPIKIDNEANKLINDVSLNSLEKLSKILKKLDKWDANEIEHTIKNFLKDEGLNFKDIGLPLRAVLVGFLSPIGINTIIESLGKDEVLARIEDIIK
ncbi:MAG: glutamate--tRNA ligase [Pseudomonadota bacterium]|jgi:glutamyl-tRNA synthetase|nr:glutamate--tRNA ligase [Rhodobiaceae bacterium]MEC9074669.1 glutamate--tRNA ligase [Pseudomonadota bacterium]MEC9382320.1 glutamate--tRNA ligase [Pseudomonadota bacterium]MED5254224.1 glutamate--tRNA ligase [Pseudomonadota bacterium]MED5273276.1 glutamate--tRNA ligase [Pseudomonadota bacterium]|tara:strand:+ start:630 stop:1931 length:1302 start_codon:yes stop_codon:yes gene_type:complete